MRHLVTILIILTLSPITKAATFTVDTSSDANLSACTATADDCSLRGAITAANTTPAADNIHFSIPQSDPGFQSATRHWRIRIAEEGQPLLSTGASVVIDGTTQPGALANSNTPQQGGLNGTLKIEISGATENGNAGFAFLLDSASASVLRGLVINGYNEGQVYLGGTGAHRVEGCYLGTDVSGSTAARLDSVIRVSNGIQFGGNGNYVVGGTLPGERNLLSGLQFAFRTAGTAVASPRIQGNLVGTNAAGTAVIGNDFGILASGFGNALIGGSAAEARNVFSGHNKNALWFTGSFDADFANTKLLGNYFGTDVTGTRALGNDLQRSGASIVFHGFGCRLAFGGINPGEANLIAYSATAGVGVFGCMGLQTPLNRYLGNARVAFDNSFEDVLGSTPNDPNDPDERSNRLQNFPELSLPAEPSTLLSYRVDTAVANATYPITVNFYRAGCGGGSDALVASASISAAQAQQTQTLDTNTLGSFLPLTATAVDAAGNTSEFAPALGEEIFRHGFEDVLAPAGAGSCR